MDEQTWNKTIRLPGDFPARLERFIRDPSSRAADVFFEETFDIGDRTTLTVTVKHDLYQGVVLHLTLLADDGSRYLGGTEAEIAEATDLPGQYEVRRGSRRYRVRLAFS